MHATEMIGMICVVLTAGFVLRTLIVSFRQQRAAALQAELMSKLIDRVGSTPELGKWIENGGLKLIEFESQRSNPQSRILNSVQTGLVSAALGAGLTAVAGHEREIQSAGIILVMVGLGFLLSAAAAYALSKSWGILKTDADSASKDAR